MLVFYVLLSCHTKPLKVFQKESGLPKTASLFAEKWVSTILKAKKPASKGVKKETLSSLDTQGKKS